MIFLSLNKAALCTLAFLFAGTQIIPTIQAQAVPQQLTIPRQIDRMYQRGLNYLVKEQKEDGTFAGNYGSEPATMAFCIMSALAHGDDPNVGPYAGMIKKCVNHIIESQDDSGFIGDSMYTHGFATLALAELYGMVPDERIGETLSKAVDLTISAQKINKIGAWRYAPDAVNDGDSTIVGCQIVSLIAARNAGIPIGDKVFEDAMNYMATCYCKKGGFAYTHNGTSDRGSVTLTAIGVLCMALNKKIDDLKFKPSVELLKTSINNRESHYIYYFEYYMAQALFHADLPTWEEWNRKNIQLMEATQRPNGSWGNGYNTALGLLSLALNYRFLPIYEK